MRNFNNNNIFNLDFCATFAPNHIYIIVKGFAAKTWLTLKKGGLFFLVSIQRLAKLTTKSTVSEKRRTSSNSLFTAGRNLGKHRLFQAVKMYSTAVISTPLRFRG
jgi:hypothetical protein